MADLRTSISLTDNMSGTLSRINDSLSDTVTATQGVDRAFMETFSGNILGAFSEITSRLDRMIGQHEQIQSSADDIGNAIMENASRQEEFNRKISSGKNFAEDLLKKVKGVAASYLTMQSAASVMDVADELSQTKARIDSMNDGVQKTPELMNMIYGAAQRARGDFGGMADVVARFGNNAKDAFGSSSEVVQFAEIIQKQMAIAGAGTQEAQNAMLQLSQALGSGVLRGDELNSIFEQAPNLIQTIADYMGVPLGEIRELASEGAITADIVKNAMFASADEINAKFNSMPVTFAQAGQRIKNTALVAFTPVLEQISSITSSTAFSDFTTNTVESLAWLSGMALEVISGIGDASQWVSSNISVIEPIIWGLVTAFTAYAVIAGIVAAVNLAQAASTAVLSAHKALDAGMTFAETAAQYGLNAALAACPVTRYIAYVIALVAAMAALLQYIANVTGAAQTGFGILTGGINVVIQAVKNAGLLIAIVALGIWNALGAVCSNIGIAFGNVISNVQGWFYSLLSTVCSVVAGIAAALNSLPFVTFDYAGISNAASEYAAKSAEAYGNVQEYENIGASFQEGMGDFDAFGEGWAADAFEAGASWGDGVADKAGSFLDGILPDFGEGIELPSWSGGGGSIPAFDPDILGGIGADTSDIAGSSGAAAKALSATTEDLKYLRDIAEQEAINRFTTAEVKVDFGGVTNNVSENTDLDGVIDYLAQGVSEALSITAEGVHD